MVKFCRHPEQYLHEIQHLFSRAVKSNEPFRGVLVSQVRLVC